MIYDNFSIKKCNYTFIGWAKWIPFPIICSFIFDHVICFTAVFEKLVGKVTCALETSEPTLTIR